jgi:hypothetical protein
VHQDEDNNKKHHQQHQDLDHLVVCLIQLKILFFFNSFLFFLAEVSTPPSPRTRPSTLLSHQSASNGQFYGNNSPKILSPLKSQSPHHTFNQNLAMMSIIQQQQQQQQPVLHHHHHSSIPYGTYTNRNNGETFTNENQPIFDG